MRRVLGDLSSKMRRKQNSVREGEKKGKGRGKGKKIEFGGKPVFGFCERSAMVDIDEMKTEYTDPTITVVEGPVEDPERFSPEFRRLPDDYIEHESEIKIQLHSTRLRPKKGIDSLPDYIKKGLKLNKSQTNLEEKPDLNLKKT